MNLQEYSDEFTRLSGLIDEGLKAMRLQAREWAKAENDYRKETGQAWMLAPEGTVPERTAWVKAKTADKRLRRDLAEGMGKAAYQAVQARRTQVSALQSMLNADRAELDLARTGPS